MWCRAGIKKIEEKAMLIGIFGESCTGKSTLAVAEILKRL
jgi:uridine kinase